MKKKKNKLYDKLHKKSSYHRKELESSRICGCFYCCRIYAPKEIYEWCDGDQTAICPRCGIDSVLPLSETDPDNKKVLRGMYEYWFCWGKDQDGNWKKLC